MRVAALLLLVVSSVWLISPSAATAVRQNRHATEVESQMESASAFMEEESSLRGTEAKRASMQQSLSSSTASPSSSKGNAAALVQRLTALEQQLADGQNAIRHQYNVQRMAEDTERKTQDMAEKLRRREALQEEQTEAAAKVTATIAQAHEALSESRRKDIDILETKKAKAVDELKSVLAQLKTANIQLDDRLKASGRRKTEVDEMTATRDRLAGEIKSLKAQRQQARVRLQRANKVVEATEGRKKSLETSIAELKSDRSTMRGVVKGLTSIMEEVKAAYGNHAGGSEAESGCYAALARVRDRLDDTGGSFKELEKLKSHLEDRVDALHAMVATLTARADSLDRDAPGTGGIGGGEGEGMSDTAAGVAGSNDVSDEVSNATAEDLAAESEISDAEVAGATENDAGTLGVLQQALDRSEAAIALAKRNGKTGTISNVQPVQVHVSPAPSPSPAPSMSPAPSPSQAPPANNKQQCCAQSLPCCHQVVAVAHAQEVTPLQAFVTHP